ncbi:metalloproteinase [Bacteroides ovatus]|nr:MULTISPECIES: metalloproteinase [Bacteroides]NAA10012.1 metalloproteinase [Escherichia coli]KAA4626703.1 metalloproteinase [Bacteroides ovatus]KAA4672522.1 metalloproteinase [Bacteroides ovatus]KAA4681557.1 metalloproteinase [Bacteroides ovatus]RGE81318.1 metalloproteinase [Bacteroides sp. AF32-8BH]
MNTGRKISQHTEDAQSTGVKRERRDSTISFRVSRTQREHIGRLADKCGMTLSDYVLARSYNYRPKARLNSRQEAVRDELIIARSDYARYTSMLNAMPQDERRAMFRNRSWMVGALQLLGKTAEAITRIIDRHFAPNRIPESPQIQKQSEPTEEEP